MVPAKLTRSTPRHGGALARLAFAAVREAPTLLFTSPWTCGSTLLIFSFAALVILLWIRHRRARLQLSAGRCNLPTVLWRPRFVNYAPDQDEGTDENESGDESPAHHAKKVRKKMPSSSITNVLPRMERLGGPYGMYGTIYGLTTRVVHVAHPVPARAILAGTATTATTTTKAVGGGGGGKQTSPSPGATKSPAYNHFKNFSGDGVFTADGQDWKSKRTSVVHCLLRGVGGGEKSPGSVRLEREANLAAEEFIGSIERERSRRGMVAVAQKRKEKQEGSSSHSSSRGRSGGSTTTGTGVNLNIVPVLQRATIGLIYRFITHHHVDLSQDVIDGNSSGGATVPVSERRDGIDDDDHREEISSHKSDSDPDSDSDFVATPRSSATSISSESTGSPPSGLKPHIDRTESNAKEAVHSNGTEPATATAPSTAPLSSSPSALLSSYLQSVTRIRMIILAQSRSFWFLTPRWFYRNFSSMFRAEEETMGPIRDFANAACRNARAGSPLASLRDRKSHNQCCSTAATAKEEEGFVPKAILDEAITLLFAGQDTSAATLSWTLHLLSLYPEVQERVVEELRSRLSDENSDGSGNNLTRGSFYTKRLVSNMPYLDAVIKESMRLYPVAPFIVRRLPCDVAVPPEEDSASNGSSSSPVVLPEGTLACVWIYGLHRNGKLWDRPNDFLPERWINPRLRDLDDGQGKAAFMPFAAGPRNCLGQPIAQVVLRIMLARILNEYEVVDDRVAGLSDGDDDARHPADDVDPIMSLRKDMQAGFTVLPSGGVRLSLHRRMKR